MNLNISSGVKGLKSVITANSPVLLAGAAIAGVFTTGVLAARAGYKARGIVDEERMRRVTAPEPPFDTFLDYYKTYVDYAKNDDPINFQDKAKLTWLCYVAPVATGLSSIASIVGVHMIHTKRHAALAGLYALSTSKLDDVSEKAEELLGPKKAQQLRNELAQKNLDEGESPTNSAVIITGDGTALTKDALSNQFFTSSINQIEAAVNKINAELAQEGNVALNDLYDYLHLDPIGLGDRVGWSGTLVEAKFGEGRAPDGQLCNVVTFQPAPTPKYRER